jgi:hypothetical protein
MPRAALFVCTIVAAACCKNPAPHPASVGATTAAPVAAAKPAAPAERPETKAACDAAGGVWDRRGLENREGCLLRTKDSGRPCRDGTECEGDCLADENGFEVVDKGPPPKGFWRGRCSEHDTTFGCYRAIPDGARKRGPLPEDDAADAICVD